MFQAQGELMMQTLEKKTNFGPPIFFVSFVSISS